jgi:YVTN family beta-propeller protein
MIDVARSLKHLWLALALVPFAASAETVRIYVTNSAGDNIHVVDPATNQIVQEIKGYEAVHGVAFAPDGSKVYISNEPEHSLDVLDGKTGNLIKRIPLSNRPNNIAVSKDGSKVVVGIARGPGLLDIVDTKTLTKTVSIAVKGALHNVYVTPDGKHVITGSLRTNIMTVIDLQKEEIAWELDLKKGVRPMAIEASPDGSTRRVFVQLTDLNGAAVVDFATRKEVARITLPQTPVEFETDAARAHAPSHGIGVTPDNKTLWVTSIPNNAVFVYSLADLKLIGEVPLPALKLANRGPIASVPNWVTFTPDSKTIYVSNAAIQSVTAIDVDAMKIKAVIKVGESPKRIGTMVRN